MVDTYGRWYPDYPGQQPFQDPAYMRAVGQPVHQQQPAQMPGANQPDMTPTIHAEIKQVDSIEAIDRIPMAGGTSQMFMTKDESMIIIRSMFANGQHSDEIYDKRPPAPPVEKFNPAEYVRKDEVETVVKDALTAYIATMQQVKKEST